jgi:hypothetical protein
MQQPFPANATGVPVEIDVLDSNGNYRNIGIATSDLSGKFSFTWTPDIQGDFTVIASFHGSIVLSCSEAFTASAPAPTAAPIATATPSMSANSVPAVPIISLCCSRRSGVLLENDQNLKQKLSFF